MPSVDLIMLRSEATWFPRFIAICESKVEYWMYPHDSHYEWMQRVAQSKRQVQDVLKAYNNEDFTEWIHSLLETARKIVAREDEWRRRGAVFI